ncbi:hypothetical protein C8R42DRAFT_472805 [Lentinula raphanica]|nr:hypothetical protein C8R42DRAFT_472805 [Lentinula raphanica]
MSSWVAENLSLDVPVSTFPDRGIFLSFLCTIMSLLFSNIILSIITCAGFTACSLISGPKFSWPRLRTICFTSMTLSPPHWISPHLICVNPLSLRLFRCLPMLFIRHPLLHCFLVILPLILSPLLSWNMMCCLYGLLKNVLFCLIILYIFIIFMRLNIGSPFYKRFSFFPVFFPPFSSFF